MTPGGLSVEGTTEMTPNTYRLSIDRVVEAASIIDPVFLDTPQFISDSLSKLLGLSLLLKIETLNPIRSFKGRGAEVLVSGAVPGTRLYCASAGNFGQAMAYSCRKRNIPLTVYASTKANPLKLERMRSLGAEVILFGDDFDAAKLEGKRISKERNATFVEDSLDIGTLEGAATIGLELLKFPGKIDTIVIALFNGALFNGVARVVKHFKPEIKLVAVQAKGAPAMIDSWRASRVVSHETTHTISDGIAVRIPVPQALKDMKGLVDEAILVDDTTTIRAMRLIHEQVGVVSEPSGAVGLAAIMENPSLFSNQTVATIVCGGNLTRQQMDEWLA